MKPSPKIYTVSDWQAAFRRLKIASFERLVLTELEACEGDRKAQMEVLGRVIQALTLEAVS